MPKPKKGYRLGGSPAHQRLILANLATSLFEHRSIMTTETKARLLRPYAEKLITKAKKADAGLNPVHQRREVLKVIRDKSIVHELFTEIAPMFSERPGGYTRITKVGPRPGDNAPMAVIELVTDAYQPKESKPATSKSSDTAPAESPAAEEPVEVTGEPETAELAEAEVEEAEATQSNEVEETADAEVEAATPEAEDAEVKAEAEDEPKA